MQPVKRNYENMVSENRNRNPEKVLRATEAIQRMLDNHLPLNISVLSVKTGLSRSFFYTNETVRVQLEHAKSLQKGKDFAQRKHVVFDKALEKEILLLRKKIQTLESRISSMKIEINKLETALSVEREKRIAQL